MKSRELGTKPQKRGAHLDGSKNKHGVPALNGLLCQDPQSNHLKSICHLIMETLNRDVIKCIFQMRELGLKEKVTWPEPPSQSGLGLLLQGCSAPTAPPGCPPITELQGSQCSKAGVRGCVGGSRGDWEMSLCQVGEAISALGECSLPS